MPPAADADNQRTQNCLQQHKVSHQAASDCLLWCSAHCPTTGDL